MDNKEDLIQYRLQRAEQSLQEAQWAIAKESLTLAENRMYYSLFYSVSAIALKYDFSTSKHSTLRGWFNQMFIKTKEMDLVFGKTYSIAFEKRQKADYDDFVEFSLEEVINDYKNTEEFINEIKKMISKDQ